MPSAKIPTQSPNPSFWSRLPRLKTAATQRRAGLSLYEAIVAQARSEALYRDHGVPDTVNGRFEMTALHVALVATRLQEMGDEGKDLARVMMEAFVADIDDACRRLGIGDMGVPKQVKKATAAVMERGRVYHAAMSTPPTAEKDALADALAANIWGAAADGHRDETVDPRAIADYVRRAVSALAQQPHDGLIAGTVTFPKPTLP